MKIYISVDMEGVAGVADWEHCIRGRLDYPEGRELLMGEVNSAIEGCLEMGAREVVVNDAHDGMVNLLPSKLHPEARLLLGKVKPLSMMQGIGKGFDAALFIGYHASAGVGGSAMAHTYSSAILQLKINGKVLSEGGINGLLAGYYGVPLVFMSGDKRAVAEMKKLNPKMVGVAVKESQARKAILSIAPQKARQLIKKGVKEALEKRSLIKPLKLKSPFTMEVTLLYIEMADLCERVPGTKRLDERRLRFQSADFMEVFQAFLTIMNLASSLL